MNKLTQWFALLLINRRIRKIEKQAFKDISNIANVYKRRKARLSEYIKDPSEYAELLALRTNIASINNPWQGAFASTYWAYKPKNEKYVK